MAIWPFLDACWSSVLGHNVENGAAWGPEQRLDLLSLPFQMLSAHLKRQLALTAQVYKNCLHNPMHDEEGPAHLKLL